MNGSESWKRLLTEKTADREKMFLPISIDGVEETDHFITTPKLLILGACGVALIAFILLAVNGGGNIPVTVLVWFIAFSFVLRYAIFEEIRFRKAYERQIKSEITTPAEFYHVASIKETCQGAVIVYESGRIGVMIQLSRGTIVGRKDDFAGQYYDAKAEMYHALLRNKYGCIILDVSEATGEDKSVDELGKLVTASQNANIRLLMEWQVGYIKTVVNHTIYAKEYYLIYAAPNRVDRIIQDTRDAMRLACEGVDNTFEVLDAAQISAFMAEQFGVVSFSGEEAVRKGEIRPVLKIVGIEYSDGLTFAVGDEERNKIEIIRRGVEAGNFAAREVSLRDALTKRDIDSQQLPYQRHNDSRGSRH